MNRGLIEDAVDEAFLGADFSRASIETSEGIFSRIFAGNGMVWGVSILTSFDSFEDKWKPQGLDEAMAITLLSRASKAEERWNLSVVAIVLEPVTEAVLPVISRFQEDPNAFARFVIALDPDETGAELQERIGFLLLRWLNSPSVGVGEELSIESDIQAVVTDVGESLAIGNLNSTIAALNEDNVDAKNVAKSLYSDVRRTPNDAAH